MSESQFSFLQQQQHPPTSAIAVPHTPVTPNPVPNYAISDDYASSSELYYACPEYVVGARPFSAGSTSTNISSSSNESWTANNVSIENFQTNCMLTPTQQHQCPSYHQANNFTNLTDNSNTVNWNR